MVYFYFIKYKLNFDIFFLFSLCASSHSELAACVILLQWWVYSECCIVIHCTPGCNNNGWKTLKTLNSVSPLSSLQPTTKLFIDGKFVESKTSEWLDVHNPVSASPDQVQNWLVFQKILFWIKVSATKQPKKTTTCWLFLARQPMRWSTAFRKPLRRRWRLQLTLAQEPFGLGLRSPSWLGNRSSYVINKWSKTTLWVKVYMEVGEIFILTLISL